MALIKSIATVGGFTIASRVTGFARDIMIAQILGAGLVADVFFVAFKFPNLFRRLFAEGAFAAAFVPLYAGMVETDGKEVADAFARRAQASLAVILLGFIAVMEMVMPWAMVVFAPGFDAVDGKIELAVELSRITFPYLLFISLVSLQSGVLNSLGRFAAAAGTPILLNLTLMAALVLANPLGVPAGEALACGVTAAGVIQFAWLSMSVARAGVRLGPVWPRLDPKVRLLIRRILPVAFGAGLYQINLLIDTVLASLVSNGAVSYLYYADRVNQLPLGVVGIAIGTALLPLLSRQIGAGDEAGAQANQNRALEFALLLTVPAAVALALLAGPIVNVLFERGAFGPAESAATAAALAAFAVGLPSFVLVKVFAPGFFARHDTATPVKIAAVALLVNVSLSLALMGPLKHVGIALASALSSWVNAALLGWILYRRGQFRLDARVLARTPRVLASTAVMGGAVFALHAHVLAPLFAGPLPVRVGALAAEVGTGIAVFAGMVVLTGAARLSDLKGLRRKRS